MAIQYVHVTAITTAYGYNLYVYMCVAIDAVLDFEESRRGTQLNKK